MDDGMHGVPGGVIIDALLQLNPVEWYIVNTPHALKHHGKYFCNKLYVFS